jgi:hypothetical protein
MGWTAGGKRRRESREQLGGAQAAQPVVLLRGMHVERRDGYEQPETKCGVFLGQNPPLPLIPEQLRTMYCAQNDMTLFFLVSWLHFDAIYIMCIAAHK